MSAKKLVDLELLVHAYTEELLTLDECGERFGISRAGVKNRLKALGVPRRKPGSGHDKRGENNPNYRGGIEYSCAQCGKTMRIRPSRVTDNNHFCSKICASTWMSEHQRGEASSRWLGGDVRGECAFCEGEFVIIRSEANRGKGKYCSLACAGAARTTRFPRLCITCGKEFMVQPSQSATAKYCSNECRHIGLRTRTERDEIQLRIDRRVSALVWYELRKGSGKGGRSWKQLVPYTVDELRIRLHETMPAGYTWDDFLSGELEIDHIRPRASFSYESPEDEEFQKCWATNNLQLLPKLDNIRKGARWEPSELDIADAALAL